MEGNNKEMREALNEIRARLSYLYRRTDGTFNPPALKEIYEIAETAIAKQPRNYDVRTSDEQSERFRSFCSNFQSDIRGMCHPRCQCIGCRNKCHCLTKWLQMKYEEGETK